MQDLAQSLIDKAGVCQTRYEEIRFVKSGGPGSDPVFVAAWISGRHPNRGCEKLGGKESDK
jgi:hypothetical protein